MWFTLHGPRTRSSTSRGHFVGLLSSYSRHGVRITPHRGRPGPTDSNHRERLTEHSLREGSSQDVRVRRVSIPLRRLHGPVLTDPFTSLEEWTQCGQEVYVKSHVPLLSYLSSSFLSSQSLSYLCLYSTFLFLFLHPPLHLQCFLSLLVLLLSYFTDPYLPIYLSTPFSFLFGRFLSFFVTFPLFPVVS